MATTNTRGGLRSSETSGAEITAYRRRQGDALDALLFDTQTAVRTFRGKSSSDEEGGIVSIETSKGLGSSSGSWSATLKESADMGRSEPAIRDLLLDDDWIDITFFRHGKPWHTLRGLVESVRVQERGSTRTVYLAGRDAGCVLDKSKVWFNRVVGEQAFNISQSLFRTGKNLSGTPLDVVETIVFGFLEAVEEFGRGVWLLPDGMPGVGPGSSFSNVLEFAGAGFSNDPERTGSALQLIQPNGEGVWQLAQEYSDPMFTELFFDTVSPNQLLALRNEGQPALEDEVTAADTRMALVMRDKPFPRNDLGLSSAWFQLPILEVSRSDVISSDLGASGSDRFNAYYAAPRFLEANNYRADIIGPLWDVEDIKQHGLRPFNVQSRYSSTVDGLRTFTTALRERLRDWHALGPYFRTGEIELGRLFPEAKIGTRLRVVSDGVENQEDFYIESVSHSWNAATGGYTSLGVTRGWRGGDQRYLQALSKIVQRYTYGV